MDARLDAVERGLEAVSRLSSATAKGQGKERSQRLVLVLATGSFRERVVALVDVEHWCGSGTCGGGVWG